MEMRSNGSSEVPRWAPLFRTHQTFPTMHFSSSRDLSRYFRELKYTLTKNTFMAFVDVYGSKK